MESLANTIELTNPDCLIPFPYSTLETPIKKENGTRFVLKGLAATTNLSGKKTKTFNLHVVK